MGAMVCPMFPVPVVLTGSSYALCARPFPHGDDSRWRSPILTGPALPPNLGWTQQARHGSAALMETLWLQAQRGQGDAPSVPVRHDMAAMACPPLR
jgi:hypothetical protein